jgi:ribosomal protein S17
MQRSYKVEFYARLPKAKDKPVYSVIVKAESALHAHDVARQSNKGGKVKATHTVANLVKEADNA